MKLYTRILSHLAVASGLCGAFSLCADQPTPPLELRQTKVKLNPSTYPGVTVASAVDKGTGVTVPVKVTLRSFASGTRITFSGGGELVLSDEANTGVTTLKGDLTLMNLVEGETGNSEEVGLAILNAADYPPGSNGQSPTIIQQDNQGLTKVSPMKGNFAGATIIPGGWRTKGIYVLNEDSYAGTSYSSQWNLGDVDITTPKTKGELDNDLGSMRHSLSMKWAMIAAPLVSRPVSFLLGSKISRPRIDEKGDPIVDPESYWQAMPYADYQALSASVVSGGTGYELEEEFTIQALEGTESAATFKVTKIESNGEVKQVQLVGGGKYIGSSILDARSKVTTGSGSGLYLNVKKGFPGFYWSPHANAVFATQPGVVNITWIRNTPVPDNDKVTTPKISYVRPSKDNNFALLEQTYIVSGSPVKRPKTIYWTEKTSTGPLVEIPNAQVNAVNIVFNSNFPERVAQVIPVIGETSIVSDLNQTLQDTRTLWFEYGALHANNAEGRAFVEYLGAIKPNGKDRVHLGSEIVEVIREAKPEDVTVDLGDALYPVTDRTKYPELHPKPIYKSVNPGEQHLYDFTSLDGVRRLYSVRETEDLNDVLVYWMEKGEQGILWPRIYSRYKLQWPLEASKYSHYARARVDTADEALKTAVSLPPENNPILDYQSDEQLQPAEITADQKFYTWLKEPLTEHRALIRNMNAGRIWFERVYSFLDTWVEDPSSETVSGDTWFSDENTDKTNEKPRHLEAEVMAGSRIDAPDDDSLASADAGYWAGHINTDRGTSYNPNAYIDPMLEGFEAANQGAIIPVNSEPGDNQLEIWWYRESERVGFKSVYWPSIVGVYTIKWPHEKAEYVAENTVNTIVLASNDGSGPLNSLQAKGSIYIQNNKLMHGYNPNEEHALMIGGQAYALRDDLNIHREPIPVKSAYSSDPYVLLEFTGSDGRPDMRAFQVLREQPEQGIIFDYEVEAGTILQAPMPLPLLDKPLVDRNPGQPLVSLNKEVGSSIAAESSINAASGLSAVKTELTTIERHHFKDYSMVSLQDTREEPVTSRWFYLTDVDYEKWTIGGFVSVNKPVAVTDYVIANETITANQHRYTLGNADDFSVGDNLVVIAKAKSSHWLVKVKATGGSTIDLEFLPDTKPAPLDSAVSSLFILTPERGITEWQI